MKRAWVLLALLALLTVALLPVLAGCGSNTTTTTAAGTAATTAPATSATTAPATSETTAPATSETTAPSSGTGSAEADAKAADDAIAAVTKSADIEMPPTVKSGELQAGSDTAFAPMEFSDQKGGYIGFDVDLCTALAKKAGLTLKVVPTAWDGIIPALISSRYDIIMSAMTITDDRKKQINFTDGYLPTNLAITTKAASPITDANGLVGKTVGVQVDTTGQFEVEKITGVKAIKKYDTIVAAIQDLLAGRVDAVVNDSPVNAYYIKDKPEFGNTGAIGSNDQYGYGIKKENTQLLDALNKALTELKSDGTYDKIHVKWFGAAK